MLDWLMLDLCEYTKGLQECTGAPGGNGMLQNVWQVYIAAQLPLAEDKVEGWWRNHEALD